ncbi:hypothetical protein Poli38472_010051 [Pythium oligandrum]|uniref:Uncharacterized protein n=1 Tax=Pythium oligandrum TaxID=41045 RepID=A0A8K1C8G0_PYTOL|nr:hypothetical protein Poli38472_010051 [Pythium oligandrum]|eukprot:TMW58492.1 hypothetical protein Poli38472_010051 [Pythium oligandrum]
MVREQQMLRELRKFHRENAHLLAPVVSTVHKKRVRVPRVDVDANPFCVERQLADEYALHNFNKNPRFYLNTIKQSPPRIEKNPHNHSSFINDAADMMASSGFSPRIRAEFTTPSAPSVSYKPMDYVAPSVISVDPSDLRSIPKNHPLSPEKNAVHVVSKFTPPTHAYYGSHKTTQPVSFGHRPDSASRMYDPLTSGLTTSRSSTGDGPSRTPVRTGMSVMELHSLLTPTKAKQDKPKDRSESSQSPASIRKQKTERSADGERANELRELERGFDNLTYYPPRARKEIRFQAPTNQTTAQLFDKYRKLAVGKLPPTS